MVLADRGFTCQDHYRHVYGRNQNASIHTREKQLDKMEVDWSRELSLVRIHIERVMGVLKQKYTILQNVLPVQFCDASAYDDDLAIIDKVVHVCCALTNLTPSVVPQD